MSTSPPVISRRPTAVARSAPRSMSALILDSGWEVAAGAAAAEGTGAGAEGATADAWAVAVLLEDAAGIEPLCATRPKSPRQPPVVPRRDGRAMALTASPRCLGSSLPRQHQQQEQIRPSGPP